MDRISQAVRACARHKWRPRLAVTFRLNRPSVGTNPCSATGRKQLLSRTPLDHLPNPTIHTMCSPNTAGHALPSLPLNSRTSPNSNASYGSLFHSFATPTANDSPLNLIVSWSAVTSSWPFLLFCSITLGILSHVDPVSRPGPYRL